MKGYNVDVGKLYRGERTSPEEIAREGGVDTIIERVAMAMWIDYVHTAAPPVEWYKKDNYKHWIETATERDRQAWRRLARVAVEAMHA